MVHQDHGRASVEVTRKANSQSVSTVWYAVTSRDCGIVFVRGFFKLGGACCERAFQSIHILAAPLSNPNLFVLLTTQIMCPNSALTLEAWKYRTGYAASKTGIDTPLRRLFQGFNDYVKDLGIEPYLDLETNEFGDELLKHKRYAGGLFPFFSDPPP